MNPSHLEVALKCTLWPSGRLTRGRGGCKSFGKGENPPRVIGSNLSADELLSNSFLPLGGKSSPGTAGKELGCGRGAGAEGLTRSVCSQSLVTKEKGSALGKETKHPLPRG